MKKMIKKYLGIVGFLLGMVGMIIFIIYQWNGTDLEPLGEISFFFCATTAYISSLTNEVKPKKWWVYTVSIISLVLICALIFI